MDVHSILRDAEAQKAARAEQMPTEFDCLRVLTQAHLRLKELGWREACYAPKDGSYFDAIEPGCSGIQECFYLGDWPRGTFLESHSGDLWPCRPSLFRPKAAPSTGEAGS